MSLADYQKMLQDARGHQLVSFEDFFPAGDEDFLERHLTDNDADPATRFSEDRGVKQLLVAAIGSCRREKKMMMALCITSRTSTCADRRSHGGDESRVCQLHSQAIARLRAQVVGEVPAAQAPGREEAHG